MKMMMAKGASMMPTTILEIMLMLKERSKETDALLVRSFPFLIPMVARMMPFEHP